jgi:hypothetical protein
VVTAQAEAFSSVTNPASKTKSNMCDDDEDDDKNRKVFSQLT